ncbi:hypothetical protein CHS0354_025137 [Potamilus streckersoni]|uniref:Uncharacterized protein n=1 Tax=Potamilus streckersoni TaxID=2493646 RepID=A0AAE0RW73_9BIVA|nr:hypothetical protein CHS0354_025137 [Potamilus streckersoni]
MRINLLLLLFLSFIGDVFSQRSPMMMFLGFPGPMVPGRFPVNGFVPRFAPFPSGFAGAPRMQPGFLGLPGPQPGFQGPIIPRGSVGSGFQMIPSGSMTGTSFPGSGQMNGMTNLVIPSPQFNGAASLFGPPGGPIADVRRVRIPFQQRHRNQPDNGVVLDRAVVQQWQRQRLTQGNGGQDMSIRQAPTIPQFSQDLSNSVDSFPTIPAQQSGSNGVSSSVSTSPMLAPVPNFPSLGFPGTIIIPQQQPGLSAQPSGIPLTSPSGFGPSSSLFGQRDQFQGIIADTNGQFQQEMTGFPTQSQAPIIGPSITETFMTRFQPLPQNVENFRQQLQTGRAGTGVDTAFPMVPSDKPAFSIQFQNNEPVRAIPAESSQVANRVVQSSNASINAPTGQAFPNQFQFTDPSSSQSQATVNVQPVFGHNDLPNVNPSNNQIPSQQVNSQVPSNNVFKFGLQPSVPSQGSGLTDPKSLSAEQFRAATNVVTAPVAPPLDVSNRIPDLPQAAQTHSFINLLSSPSDFSFFADQSRKDSKTTTNLVDSQSIDSNQRVIFSMDSKGPAVRLQQVDSAPQNTFEGVGVSQLPASAPKGGNNSQSFSFTVSGNSNRVKVEPPSPPSVGLTGPSQTGNTPDKPKAAAAGAHDNPSAAPIVA